MAIVETDAVVLHVFDYLETSRIYRLLTRDAGLQSVLARGARRPKSRFGRAVDLFAEGTAQLSIRPGRELQTAAAFDVTRARPRLALDLDRFTAAAAIVELVLRFVRDEGDSAVYDIVCATLDSLADPTQPPRDAALAGAWRLISELGFAPSVDDCGGCHATIPERDSAAFSHPAGGVLCPSCSGLQGQQRSVPATARAMLRAWLSGDEAAPIEDERQGRAHQRLLREFLEEHLVDGRELRAFDIWTHGAWGRAPDGQAPRRLDSQLSVS